jgi:hypothetical protein
MTHSDHVFIDGKWHCEVCGAYNPKLYVDFDHFYTMVQASNMVGDKDYWRKKYDQLKRKTLIDIKREMPFLAVKAIGSFSS